jgi:4-amino-4-deoxy-L-arabinose transferase-like glycosyltransferase
MKSNKLHLALQFFILLPFTLFLFIYTEGMGYLALTIGVLGYLGLNSYQFLKRKKMFMIPVLFLLMGSFYVYTFNHLGSNDTPQTYETLKDGQSVTLFDFGEETKIDKLCYYVGIDKDVSFTLEYRYKDKWTKFYTYENSYPYSFKWRCIQKGYTTQKVLFRVLKNEMMLNEVRFSYKGKDVPYTTSKKLLNDEPEAKVDSTYYSSMFFDEIYFGRAAYEIIHNKYMYENTHPYLGKLLVIPGIKIFGMTPFGWRFVNVLFAGLLIFMAYYFAMKMFKEEQYGVMAAVLMTYSFMHLAQARIGLIDTFGVLFVFVSYFYLYQFIIKQRVSQLWLSGLFFGLAASVKWSAVFAAGGFVFIALYLLLTKYPLHKRFAGYKLLVYGVLSYGVLAFIVYLLSFFEIYAQGRGLQGVIDYNISMYNYHSMLQATHPYSSSWWTWPLDFKPMGYYRQEHDGLISTINAFGNPAIFYTGIVAVLYVMYAAFIRKSLDALFILFAFLGLYLPYVFIGRLMFIYHFYYAVPFLMLAIVYMFRDGMQRFAIVGKLFWVYLAIVVGLFLAFYPVLSGYEVEKSYVDTWLRWSSGWWF